MYEPNFMLIHLIAVGTFHSKLQMITARGKVSRNDSLVQNELLMLRSDIEILQCETSWQPDRVILSFLRHRAQRSVIKQNCSVLLSRINLPVMSVVFFRNLDVQFLTTSISIASLPARVKTTLMCYFQCAEKTSCHFHVPHTRL